jgi:hypothetical protein
MSHADKLSAALALIDEHNAQIESKEDQIDGAEFEKKLKKLGGTTEANLKECTWEDLENCGLPRILARKVAALFRTEVKTQLGEGDFISEKRAARMAPLYLIQQYKVGESDTPVAKRLIELSKGKAFLVLQGGSINVEESHKLLQEIIKGYEEREIVVIDDRPFKPVRIGDKKKEMVDENPIYRGRALRPDGSCDQLNRSWDGVSAVVRQVIYVAINDTREIVVSHTVAHDLLDKALASDSEKTFRQRYPKASTRLDELVEEGKAPTLKIALGSATRSNDPFYAHKKY